MSWNYRVVRRVVDDEVLFAVHEAYYDAPDDDCPSAITMEPVTPLGDSVEDLRAAMARFAGALAKPVLDYEGPWRHAHE